MLIECLLVATSICQMAKMRIEYAMALTDNNQIKKVFVLGHDAWKQAKGGDSNHPAFSYKDGRVAISSDYIVTASPAEMVHTIRHENGHILCQCSDEIIADTRGGNY